MPHRADDYEPDFSGRTLASPTPSSPTRTHTRLTPYTDWINFHPAAQTIHIKPPQIAPLPRNTHRVTLPQPCTASPFSSHPHPYPRSGTPRTPLSPMVGAAGAEGFAIRFGRAAILTGRRSLLRPLRPLMLLLGLWMRVREGWLLSLVRGLGLIRRVCCIPLM